MRIEKLRFSNFRAFENAELPLQQLTVLIGPNNSGKTSALSAISILSDAASGTNVNIGSFAPIEHGDRATSGQVEVVWGPEQSTIAKWTPGQRVEIPSKGGNREEQLSFLKSGRVYTLMPQEIGGVVALTRQIELASNGSGLPSLLTTLQDERPERFEQLNQDLCRWLPEYNRIVFETPSQGQRAVRLRTVLGGHRIPTSKLSTGTLLSLALLAICHMQTPPRIIGLEEPDYGLHPRLLRGFKDSLSRLTNPEAFGDDREPVQVILTTHSPYLVDLFHDELESIVVIKKEGLYSTFSRLSDLPNVNDIIAEASLGESWYSGILGGVPALP